MKKRVMIVSNTLAEGGAERWASFMVSGLDRDAFDVSLVLFRDQRTYPCPKDVSIHCVEHDRFPQALRTVRRLRRLIRHEKIDIVISNGNYTAPFVGQAIRGTDAPWIARFSGSFQHCQSSLKEQLSFRWLDQNIAYARTLVANSRGLANDVSDRWPSLKHQIAVIRNGIDLEIVPTTTMLADASEVPLVVAAGRLTKQKRPGLFVSAVKQQAERSSDEKSPSFRAVWCGDGPLRREVESQISQVDLKDHVELLGFRSDFHDLLAKASCFVLCSDHEGSPNVLAEAMTLGVPVIATDCPHGPSELIGTNRGWLVPTNDPDKLADAIGECLSNRKEAHARATRAKDWADAELDQQELIKSWSQLIMGDGSSDYHGKTVDGETVRSSDLHAEVV